MLHQGFALNHSLDKQYEERFSKCLQSHIQQLKGNKENLDRLKVHFIDMLLDIFP